MNEVTSEITGTEPEIITSPQDPVQVELEREERRTEGRTEVEKASFSLKKNAERLRELGGSPEDILGIKKDAEPEELTDDTPLTLGAFKRLQREESHRSAHQLVDALDADDHTKNLVKKYLERVKPSGDAQEDLRFALLAVNSVKNSLIAEEASRGTTPTRFASGAGAPPRQVPKEPELTEAELRFTKAPINMTAAQIIALRPKS